MRTLYFHAHVSPGGQSGVPQGSSPLPLSPRSTDGGLGPCPELPLWQFVK